MDDERVRSFSSSRTTTKFHHHHPRKKCRNVLDRRRWVIAELMQPASWLAPLGRTYSFARGVCVPKQNIAKLYLVVPGWSLLWCLKQRKTFVRGERSKATEEDANTSFSFLTPLFFPIHTIFSQFAQQIISHTPRILTYTLSDDS